MAVNENSSIKDLRNRAANIKHHMDDLERAAYGFTMEDVIKAVGGANENPIERINQLSAHPVGEGTGADDKGGTE